MSNQLTVYKEFAFGEVTPQDVITIRETVGKDCNESQFKLFMSIAKASGANPIMNEIYPAVRSGQLTVQFGVDFFVRKSKESDGYLGYDVQTVHENDEFKMHQEKSEDGRYYVVIDTHSWGFPRGKVIGGYAIAYKEGLPPFTVVMEVEEVEHLKKSNIGMQKTMWTNYFNDMFKKHMARRALKAAFNLKFDDDQPIESGNEIPEYRERKDITPKQEIIEEPKQETKSESDHLRDEINAKFKQLGIISSKDAAEWLQTNAPNINPKTANEAEMIGLIELLDMNIDMLEMHEQQNNDDLLE